MGDGATCRSTTYAWGMMWWLGCCLLRGSSGKWIMDCRGVGGGASGKVRLPMLLRAQPGARKGVYQSMVGETAAFLCTLKKATGGSSKRVQPYPREANLQWPQRRCKHEGECMPNKKGWPLPHRNKDMVHKGRSACQKATQTTKLEVRKWWLHYGGSQMKWDGCI